MFRITMLSLLLLLFTCCDIVQAGIFCRRGCRKVVVTRAIVANKVVDIQFTPTFVSFVPSQVLLNGQVTTYGAPSTFGYSYQGGYQQAQPQAQPQAQSASDQKLDRVLQLLQQLAGGEATATVESASYASHAHGTITQSCKSCHSPGGKGEKNLLLFDANGDILEKLPRYKIYRSIQDGSMPKGGPEITDKQKLEKLRLWVHEGLESLKY